MVEEDGGANLVGIPAESLLSAYAVLETDGRARLVDLATKIDGVTVILPLLGVDAMEVAELETRLPVRATALRHARSYRTSPCSTSMSRTAGWPINRPPRTG